MATVLRSRQALRAGDRFFMISALLMAAVTVAGFSMHLGMGRSTFAVPPIYHVHAVVFMGWIGLYLAQTLLGTVGPLPLHRRLGWFATGWMVLMVVMGIAITVVSLRRGVSPFVFKPQHFLIFNPATVLAFAGLTIAAVVQRRRSDWHRRLHLTGMAMLMGPGFGRLLPLPLLIPYGFHVSYFAGMLFPLVGAGLDRRRNGRVHPAWIWGLSVMLVTPVLIELVTYSPLGDALYRTAVAGSPGEAIAPLAFKPFPGP
jgi:hypothetical protein